MRDKIILTIIFSFLVGVLLRSFWVWLDAALVYIGAVSFFLVILFLIIKNKKLIIFLFILPSFLAGVLRFSFYDLKQNKNIFNEFIGKEVTFSGEIISYPEERENTQRFIVDFKGEKILVSTEKYPKFSYDDSINVLGDLQKPKNFITDIGKEFDYINYLGKDKIFYTISFAKVSLEEKALNKNLKYFLYKTRERFIGVLEKLIPAPESSLLNGLLLGQKESLGKDLENNFIKTGLIHIVVLSGYNVTIIAESIIRALSFLPRFSGLLVGSFSIVLFAFMTGLGTTIVRASIMAIIALWARFSGNNYDITRALILAGFLMVLHNPYILYFDISFHLSFLATLGLIYLSSFVENFLKWIPLLNIRQIIGATLATQIFVLPFILYKIGTLSVIAPITNILVLPLIPLTMFFGFLTGVIGQISLVLAKPFAFISSILLSFEIFIVEFFGKISFASFSVRNFSVVFVVIFYLGIFWFLYKNNKIKEDGK
jgi:competence protein ComEC